MEVFVPILTLAFFVERLAEVLKPIWDKTKGWNKDAIIVLVGSIGFCLLTGVDAFTLANIPIVLLPAPWGGIIGSFLTGFLIAGGGNWLHELYKLLQTLRGGAGSNPFDPHRPLE